MQDLNEIKNRLLPEQATFTNKTILITGSSGFLGRVFKNYFLDIGCKVIAVDNHLVSEKQEISNPNLQEISQSVTEPLHIEGKIDYIINACGIANPFLYRQYPLQTLDVSYIGTQEMLKLALAKKAIFLAFSSSEVYGDPTQIPTPESYHGAIDTMGERSCYDEGKKIIETLCHIYNSRFGVDTRIVRPFNVFGPPLAKNDFRVIPNFISAAIQNKPLQIFGHGKQTRTFCYVTDFIVGAVKMLVAGDNLPYNIGNDNNEINMIDLALLIRKLVNKDVEIKIVNYPSVYPHEEPMRRCPDLTKARIQLGYSPEVNIEEGIKRFHNWCVNSSQK